MEKFIISTNVQAWSNGQASFQLINFKNCYDLCGPLPLWPHGNNRPQRFSIKTKENVQNSLPCLHITCWFPLIFSPCPFQYCFLLQIILTASPQPLQSSSACEVGTNNHSLWSLLRSLLPAKYFHIYYCICPPRKLWCTQGRKSSPANCWQRNWGPERVMEEENREYMIPFSRYVWLLLKELR